MDNLEEKYIEEVEREGEIFLEGLQNKKSLAQLEREYSQKVKEIRRIYEKSIKKELKKEKYLAPIKSKNNPNKNEKEFQVENLNLEDNWKQKKQIEISSISYKFGRKVKNFIKKFTPNWIIYNYYKFKIFYKNFFKGIWNYLRNIFNKIIENLLTIITYIREGFMKVISVVKKIPSLFTRKKTKEEKENNIETDKKDAKKDS